MSQHASNEARVIPLRPATATTARPPQQQRTRPAPGPAPAASPAPGTPPVREPLWRDLVGDVLRRERRAQERTLKEVADAARISMPYLSEVERGRKEASSEVLAAAAQALGLSLGDLLSLAADELTRRTTTSLRRRTATSVTRRTSTSSTRRATTTGSPHNGLCLVA
ncbi:helix-turn-helix domain-containing protein [Streptomyces neyagawaensis]|uniref:helix-turn-helix domain-containing protein n=1 Tax=Streptomyces neyagawaensis TaxID=42238 RepID=UPI00201CC1E9|nr:helix-turn-helix transcriptional regulator [Streptomyces neyagawaensis]MCL6732446.1 helix-turn-helix transcriptional regulator [Streptomyces neyagawaensis]MDE1685928.1 helix-turn-helix transcriptional regulator [Streptomyces neyagawaensis]